VVEGEACKLWDVVEDELILALPAFGSHNTEECTQTLARFNAAQAPAEDIEPAEKPNPFNVLAQLKPGSKT